MSKFISPDYVQAIIWEGDQLKLLDQRKLPVSEEYYFCKNSEDIYRAIKDMVVRGAPAIGITAGYGAVLSAYHRTCENEASFKSAILNDLEMIKASRPTAVNLMWAIDKAKQILVASDDVSSIKTRFLEFAKQIHDEDISNNEIMGELASNVMREDQPDKKFSVVTHCNAGSLATGGYGTALGAIRSAFKNNLIEHVYADETRPWLQGSRLTAWELNKSGIPVTINTEGAAAMLMSVKNVKWVIVGADRIAANGDVANKIGTCSLAVIAKHFGVKVMVVAPSSTIDMDTLSGKDIEIEHRDSSEITGIGNINLAPRGIGAYNPVFDITPSSLINCIVCEKGVIYNPNSENLRSVLSENER